MKKNVSLRGVLDHDNNDNKNNNDNNHSSLVLDNTFPVSDLEEDLRAASINNYNNNNSNNNQ